MLDTDWESYAASYPQLENADGVPPLLAGVLAARGSGHLLDMGCGEGRLLDQIRHSHPGWTLTGFELSETRGGLAREKGHHVVVERSGALPTQESSFDVVTSTHVIEHALDDRAYAADLRRMVRPGGLVYVETPVKLPGAWYFRRNPQAGWVLDPTHVREYRSAEQVNRVLTDADLQVVADELTPIRFPAASAVLLARRWLKLPQSTRQRRGLTAAQVPIPRYRQQAVLAQRPA
jgi:2-polyprenyl-3-methyl-5-hydroxy-6-metoxy-1,4-benzoquinol methylase